MASLAHLQSFLAIYRLGSLTAAASSLHLSQPALSAHLRALETERGRPLFVREARGVRPTPEADVLARAVAPHLDALAALAERAGPVSARPTVHLGGPADMLSAIALPALEPLVGQITLRTTTGAAEPLIEALRRDELDLAIATRVLPAAEITFEPLFSETLVLVASPRWRASRVAPDPEELERVPLVAFDEDLALARELWEAAFERELRRIADVTVADLRGVLALVQSGAGMAVVPRYLARPALLSGALVDLLPGHTAVTNEISLAFRPASVQRAATARVRATLQAAARSWD